MEMLVGTLAGESVISSLCTMSSASRRPFDDTPALQVSRIRRSISVGQFSSHGCFAAIDRYSTLSLIEVGAAATRMVLPLGRMIFHFCTRSVHVPDAVSAAMLGRVGWAKCLKTGVSSRARQSTLDTQGVAV